MPRQSQDKTLSADKVAIPKKRSIKHLLFGVIGVVIIGGVAIAAIWYLLWLTSPAHILAESFRNTLSLDKTTYQLTYTDSGSSPSGLNSIKIDGQYAKDRGSRSTAKLEYKNNDYGLVIDTDLAINTAGTAYYRYKNVSNSSSNDPKKQMSNEVLQQVVAAFGSHWAKLDSNMLQSGSSCAIAALQKMQSNTDLGGKLVDMVVGPGAVDVSTASQGDTATYTLKSKTDKVDALVNAYTKTSVYADLVKCDESTYKVTADSVKMAVTQGSVVVTVNKKTHRIEKFVFTRKQDTGTATLQFMVAPANKVDVTMPSDVTTSE